MSDKKKKTFTPKGDFHFYMAIDVRAIPPGFPLQKGRTYANFSTATKENIATGYIDMEAKEINIKDELS